MQGRPTGEQDESRHHALMRNYSNGVWCQSCCLLPSSTSLGPNAAQFTLTHFLELTGAISDCFQTRPQPELFVSTRSHFLCLSAASWGKAGRGGIAEEQTQGLGKFRHSPGLQGQDGFVFLQL